MTDANPVARALEELDRVELGLKLDIFLAEARLGTYQDKLNRYLIAREAVKDWEL